jgi:predicted small integral membrane protein
MDYSQPLDDLPIWAVYLLTVLLSLLFFEVGYRLGRNKVKRSSAEKEGDLGSIVGVTFGLITFFVVFMIGIAGNRFDNRRQLAIAEANAARTSYLRAGYLGEPYQTESRELLREYVAIRVAATSDPSKLPQVIIRSREIHDELWALTEELAIANPSVETVALYIDSVNEVISLHTERLMAVTLRISMPIWVIIFCLIFTAFGMMGYQHGINGNRNFVAVLILTIILSGVVLLLVDLDRPQEGLFNVSQQAMIELLEQMQP